MPITKEERLIRDERDRFWDSPKTRRMKNVISKLELDKKRKDSSIMNAIRDKRPQHIIDKLKNEYSKIVKDIEDKKKEFNEYKRKEFELIEKKIKSGKILKDKKGKERILSEIEDLYHKLKNMKLLYISGLFRFDKDKMLVQQYNQNIIDAQQKLRELTRRIKKD